MKCSMPMFRGTIRGRIEGRRSTCHKGRRADGRARREGEQYGGGARLYLLVRSREAKFWLSRYTVVDSL